VKIVRVEIARKRDQIHNEQVYVTLPLYRRIDTIDDDGERRECDTEFDKVLAEFQSAANSVLPC
jgi:hypothetical protein